MNKSTDLSSAFDRVLTATEASVQQSETPVLPVSAKDASDKDPEIVMCRNIDSLLDQLEDKSEDEGCAIASPRLVSEALLRTPTKVKKKSVSGQ